MCLYRPFIFVTDGVPYDRPTDRPTNRVRPIHVLCVILICCTSPRYPRGAAMPRSYHVNSAVRSHDSYKLRTPTMGKRKAETPAQRTARLEREGNQRTSSYLRFLVGLAMHPWVSHTSVFLVGHFTQALFHTFLHKYMCTLHSGQDFAHT